MKKNNIGLGEDEESVEESGVDMRQKKVSRTLGLGGRRLEDTSAWV